MSEKYNDSLLNIARCSIVFEILEHPKKCNLYPCYKIVTSQPIKSGNDFQLPEPWGGHIDSAPILFLSSNASISFPNKKNPLNVEEYPLPTWTDDEIIDFFTNRFNSNQKWVKNGRKNLRKNGTYRKRAVPYWAAAVRRTATLLNKHHLKVKYGYDYALAELVHCKSKDAYGVKEALKTCTDRYFDSIMCLSQAKVLVVSGKRIVNFIKTKYEIGDKRVSEKVIGGHQRWLIFPKRFRGTIEKFNRFLSDDELENIRSTLRSN